MSTVPVPRCPALPAGPLGDLLAREPVLARFGVALWLAMIPAAVALVLDDRTIRDVGVWVKPLKFLASTGLFALTSAWFVGLLPEARRRSRVVRATVWTLVATSCFEIGYITLQAALGQASHYNVGDPFHAAMYTLMGAAAVVLTATQLVLAQQLYRHGALPRGTAWRDGVLAGLVLTFVLGTIAGAALGGMLQPPPGVGLPVFGWHGAGDLRPAHFLGLHAQQALPLAGLALDALLRQHARRAMAIAIAVYVAAFAALMVLGLA